MYRLYMPKQSSQLRQLPWSTWWIQGGLADGVLGDLSLPSRANIFILFTLQFSFSVVLS